MSGVPKRIAGCSNLYSHCVKTSNWLLKFEQEETEKKHSKKEKSAR